MAGMIRLFVFVVAVFNAAIALAQNSNGPVVVELYTSQGCSSCPPADEFLHELAARDDVIALALHVDYWDYIGWKDVFADPEHAVRQRGYARRSGKRMVYTPQMVINGQTTVVGNKRSKVKAALRRQLARKNPVQVQLSRSGNRLSIRATGQARGPMLVQLVRYTPGKNVKITRGENRGRTINYANVVRDWKQVGSWNGGAELHLQTKVSGNDPVVVLVQSADYGAILGAASLR